MAAEVQCVKTSVAPQLVRFRISPIGPSGVNSVRLKRRFWLMYGFELSGNKAENDVF